MQMMWWGRKWVTTLHEEATQILFLFDIEVFSNYNY